jgi:hypothetical protein
MNLARNGELLSFRHIHAKGDIKFKSVTGRSATPGGHRYREAAFVKLNASPHGEEKSEKPEFHFSTPLCLKSIAAQTM